MLTISSLSSFKTLLLLILLICCHTLSLFFPRTLLSPFQFEKEHLINLWEKRLPVWEPPQTPPKQLCVQIYFRFFSQNISDFSETLIRHFSETLFFDHLPGLLVDFLLLMFFAKGLVVFMPFTRCFSNLFCLAFFLFSLIMLELKVRLPEFKVVFVSPAPEFTDYSCRANSEGNI